MNYREQRPWHVCNALWVLFTCGPIGIFYVIRDWVRLSRDLQRCCRHGGPQLFTAMLDADTDDVDRDDWDCRAGNLSSWFKNSVDQWAINRTMIMIIYSIDCHCQCHCADTWMNLADGTRHWFLHCTLMQLYWMICRWINVISNYWGCIGVYLWQLRQLSIRTSTRTVTILAVDVNPCRSHTMCINLFIIWNKIIKNKNTQCI